MALSRFRQANKSLTNAENFRNDFSMYMQPYMNWEMYLTSAPQSIALLGELIRISNAEDFSINKNAPEKGFQFIKYPESFRACLLQVCNAGWQAFNEAHRNMDQIRLYTGQVPDYIRNAVGILIQEDTGLVKAFLPNELQKIENISSECLKLATTSEEKFSDVIKLMEEFVEALVNARQSHSVELEEIKKKIEAERLREKSSKEANERAQAEYEKIKDELAEAKKKYTQAMDGLPSGWNLFFLKLMSSLSEAAITVTTALTTTLLSPGALVFLAGVGAIKAIAGVATTKEGQTTTSQAISKEKNRKDIKIEEEIATINILSQAGLILLLSVQMNKFYDGNKINWTELYDQKKEAANSDYLKRLFEDTKERINKEFECEVKKEALDTCNKGIKICTELAKHAPKGECDDVKAKELIEAIQELNTKAQTFDSHSKAYTGRPVLSGEPPHLSRIQNKDTFGTDLTKMHAELARISIEQSESLLKLTTERYDKYLENFEKSRKELENIVIELQVLKPKEIDFNKKIEMLAKGMEAMGRVKEQWQKLVLFFQMISNLIKTSLTSHLKSFNQIVETAVESGYTYSEFVKDQIYTYALNASATAYVVNMISTTYTEVSVQYLMNSASSLGRLMTMDPNGEAFTQAIAKLQQDCISAKEGISKLVTENKKQFELKCQNRVTQIKTTLNDVLPQISEQEKMKLKAAVNNGIKPQSAKQEETKPAAEFKPMTQKEESQFI